jgi:transposase
MSETFDRKVHHRPDQCPCCQAKLSDDLPAETAGEYETIELPEIHPLVERHRRLSVRCPSCGVLVAAKVPDAANGTPFGPRIHAVATYLKTFQALSYERLQRAFADLFGLTISQGGLMNMLRRSQTAFVPERDTAIAALRRAKVVASDETGVRIEGSNAYQWVFRSNEAVVHRAAATRASSSCAS